VGGGQEYGRGRPLHGSEGDTGYVHTGGWRGVPSYVPSTSTVPDSFAVELPFGNHHGANQSVDYKHDPSKKSVDCELFRFDYFI
jgi:hypothetical protein